MKTRATLTLLLLTCTAAYAADIRVQDIARLQGQRTNKLMGYGLVVGLDGTGDGEKYLPTMRALMSLHTRYNAPVLTDTELKGNRSVALVVVEAEIPEHGARSGQPLDVAVSVVGAAKSLAGGRLLTTPLQYVMFDPQDPFTQDVLALAGGPLDLPESTQPTQAIIRGGATLERDFFYNFVDRGYITLVLDDTHAGWTWAHVLARAVNEELSPRDVVRALKESSDPRAMMALQPPAQAIGPKNVLVRIPDFELDAPANFISRVLETRLFMMPEQAARVTINRATQQIAFTSAVRVSPTILQIPGVGTVMIGKPAAEGDESEAGDIDGIEFSELFETLSAIQVSPEQMIAAIEQLHQTGTLHAQLQYE